MLFIDDIDTQKIENNLGKTYVGYGGWGAEKGCSHLGGSAPRDAASCAATGQTG